MSCQVVKFTPPTRGKFPLAVMPIANKEFSIRIAVTFI